MPKKKVNAPLNIGKVEREDLPAGEHEVFVNNIYVSKKGHHLVVSVTKDGKLHWVNRPLADEGTQLLLHSLYKLVGGKDIETLSAAATGRAFVVTLEGDENWTDLTELYPVDA